MKAHLKNGEVYIFEKNWVVDTALVEISGNGTHYNLNRKKIQQGFLKVKVADVALFETNSELNNPESGNIALLSTIIGVNLAVNFYCLAFPKSCYGSCPTFYINENDNFHYADAEGFSNAIVPSMEYADIDALKTITPTEKEFSITMKNEALETHYVNVVKLYAFPVNANEFVYQSPKNKFYLCENKYPISKAIAEEGNISTLLAKEDINERFSLSDKNNLCSKEEIFLDFENIKDADNLGLILNFRQTLMTTYLFYSSMGYMGNEFGDLFAKLETDTAIKNKFDATTKLLGGIEIYSFQDHTQSWVLENTFNETGPIAINKQFIPLKNKNKKETIRLKLVLNKGFWRIDYAGLTNIIREVSPLILSPNRVLTNGKIDSTDLASLSNDSKYIISQPGNDFKLNFNFPTINTPYSLFLYSKGYYIEWMRKEWIKDKNLTKLRQMVYKPKRFLRKEAKNYKKYEDQMEQVFWNSKIDTKSFSLYEK